MYVADGSGGFPLPTSPDESFRVQKFGADGTFVTKWGSLGNGDGQFWVPRGVAVDSSGNVYVADSDNDRIQEV